MHVYTCDGFSESESRVEPNKVFLPNVAGKPVYFAMQGDSVLVSDRWSEGRSYWCKVHIYMCDGF